MRQIDGVGGATSTTSKVAVISPSTRPGIDVEYTFIQVAVGKESLDFSGNCGNIASGIGPFAVEEGLVKALPGQRHMDVSILNTNTSKRLVETVEIDDDGQYMDDGDYWMPGVKSPGSEVKVAFVEPAGSMTGKLFPTGNRRDILEVNSPRNGVAPFEVNVSYVDAANPFVIVDKASMPERGDINSPEYLDLLEDVRRAGAVGMGLAKDVESAALVKGTPKLAFVSNPSISLTQGKTADVFVAAMSMQKPHPSLQLTGAVCLGAAASIPGTVVYDIANGARSEDGLITPPGSEGSDSESELPELKHTDLSRLVRLAHASGTIEVDVKIDESGPEPVVTSCGVSRTARKIFDGKVMVNL
jgi:2-methylaconitate cis-trans-isomerase PrpF